MSFEEFKNCKKCEMIEELNKALKEMSEALQQANILIALYESERSIEEIQDIMNHVRLRNR